MGTQTMGSNGNGGNQNPKSDGFSKQGPLYNLTLDEVQHQLGDLGKPLSSMNLDELLKNVWTAETEGNQGVINGFVPIDCSEHAQLASASSLPSGDRSKKTVDELWQDIQLGQKKKDTSDHNLNRKNPTFGEMTLEDFLAKAGIVSNSSPEKRNLASVRGVEIESIGLPQQNVNPQWMNYQIAPIQQQHVFVPGHHQVQQPLSSTGNPVMEAGYHDTQMMGAVSDTQTPGQKRLASGDVMERTVERRQKRMIKNRESAARSRARKQAYTHELENKVSRLEEENERLRREKEAENILSCEPPPEPKYQLRRTSSALF